MSSKRRQRFSRDQAPSAFSSLLTRFCQASDCKAAALVDREGETVDYAGQSNPYEIRVAAAELRLVLAQIAALETRHPPSQSGVCEVFIRAKRRSFSLFAMTDGYALVVQLSRYAFGVSRRALAQVAEELHREAGLHLLANSQKPPTQYPRQPLSPRWTAVETRVQSGDTKRPQEICVDGVWQPVEIVGRIEPARFRTREVGYVARVGNGREIFLVREPLGRWFAADPLG